MRLVYSAVYIAVSGFIFYLLGETFPRKWFSEDKFPYKDFLWEKHGKIYNKLKIRKWKNKLLDMSKIFTSMIPKAVSTNVTPAQLQALIKETCVAEFIHYVLCFTSVGVCWIYKDAKGVFVWFLCILGNLPYIVIQRYNRPLLRALRDKMLSKYKNNNMACGSFTD